MSEAKPRAKGLFGRLFGGREAVPEALPPATQAEVAAGELGQGEAAQASNVAPPPHPGETTAEVVQEQDEAAKATEAEAAVRTEAPPVERARAAQPEPPPSPAPKQSWLSRLTAGLSKTSARLTDGITSLFTKRKLDAETLEDLEDLLIQADLGVETATRITDTLRKGRFDKGVSPEDVREVLAAEVERVLAPVARPLVVDQSLKPHVILVVGVNGTGKTTTIGKLAQRYAGEGRKVMMAAGDTFRAAAIDQLQVWGERTGARVVARAVGSDASGLAFDALKEAREGGYDVLLLDTAGRLQNKAALMDELEKVVRVVRKQDASAPHDVLLVLDATTGQNALSQVEVFKERAGVTGIVMTKLDGTARGGILVAISARFGLPVHAIGVGEGADDLQSFDAREFARAIAVS